MTTKQITSLETTKDFEIRPQPAGGFILRQHFFMEDQQVESSERIYTEFQRAFSNTADLLDFLNTSYNFPLSQFPSKPPSRPVAIKYLLNEGGAWLTMSDHFAIGDPIFALQFEDGSIWDAKSGWR